MLQTLSFYMVCNKKSWRVIALSKINVYKDITFIETMNKIGLRVCSIFALFILFVNFVSAQEIFPKTREFFSGFYDNVVEPTLKFLLSDSTGNLTGDEFFGKILLFILLLAIVWSVLERVPLFSNKKGIITLVSLIFSVLAVRYISSAEWVRGIILPYSAVGVAIMTLLPLVILIYFIYGSGVGPMAQRAMWLITLVVFIGLYFARIDKIGTFAWIYFIGGVLCLIGFLANRPINKLVHKMHWDTLDKRYNEEMVRNLRRKLHEAHEDLGSNIIDVAEYNNIKADLLAKIAHFNT